MREVVEHQTADRDLLDVEHAGGARQMFEWRVVGMERQGDEGLEPTGFVLQSAELKQVIDAVFVVLDVAVEHGCIRLESDLMRKARSIQPLVAVNLVIANDVADAVGKDFRAAAGE